MLPGTVLPQDAHRAARRARERLTSFGCMSVRPRVKPTRISAAR